MQLINRKWYDWLRTVKWKITNILCCVWRRLREFFSRLTQILLHRRKKIPCRSYWRTRSHLMPTLPSNCITTKSWKFKLAAPVVQCNMQWTIRWIALFNTILARWFCFILFFLLHEQALIIWSDSKFNTLSTTNVFRFQYDEIMMKWSEKKHIKKLVFVYSFVSMQLRIKPTKQW